MRLAVTGRSGPPTPSARWPRRARRSGRAAARGSRPTAPRCWTPSTGRRPTRAACRRASATPASQPRGGASAGRWLARRDAGVPPPGGDRRPPAGAPALGARPPAAGRRRDRPRHGVRHGPARTTRTCLELLATLAPPGSLLDAGCGSGVLAMVARRLGFDPVWAIDDDPVAVNRAWPTPAATASGCASPGARSAPTGCPPPTSWPRTSPAGCCAGSPPPARACAARASGVGDPPRGGRRRRAGPGRARPGDRRAGRGGRLVGTLPPAPVRPRSATWSPTRRRRGRRSFCRRTTRTPGAGRAPAPRRRGRADRRRRAAVAGGGRGGRRAGHREGGRAAARPAPSQVSLYLGLTDWARIDMVVEKAAELGVREVALLVSERARRVPDSEAWDRRRERLARVAQAAARQSGQVWLPRLRGLVPFADAVAEIPSRGGVPDRPARRRGDPGGRGALGPRGPAGRPGGRLLGGRGRARPRGRARHLRAGAGGAAHRDGGARGGGAGARRGRAAAGRAAVRPTRDDLLGALPRVQGEPGRRRPDPRCAARRGARRDVSPTPPRCTSSTPAP